MVNHSPFANKRFNYSGVIDMIIIKIVNNDENQSANVMSNDDKWSSLMTALEMFTDDYLKERPEQLPLQERESL